MQLEILLNRQFVVKREGLRHIADMEARLHVVRPHRFAEQFRRSTAWRQKTCQHLHSCRFAAAVRAEEAEDLAATYAEAHMVHRCEIPEPASKPLGLDGRHGVVLGGTWTRNHLLVLCALLSRQQSDEGRL